MSHQTPIEAPIAPSNVPPGPATIPVHTGGGDMSGQPPVSPSKNQESADAHQQLYSKTIQQPAVGNGQRTYTQASPSGGQAPMPMMVPHYPNQANAYTNYQYQQQVAYAQAQYYQQQQQQQQQHQYQHQHHQQQQQRQQQQQQQHPQQQHSMVQNIQMPLTPSSAPQMYNQQHPLVPNETIPQQFESQSPHQTQPSAKLERDASSYQQQPQFQTPQRNSGVQAVGSSSGSSNSRKHHTPARETSQRKKVRRSDHSLPGEYGDQDLKDQANKALTLPLQDVAQEVKIMEAKMTTSGASTPINGSSSKAQAALNSQLDIQRERKKQVFAMTWLLRACEANASAVVPRNRIYARYVGICAENGIKPLSPASFGKLVRIAFPDLTTRRLGMRGQSKYHYCGMKLIGDDGSNTPTTANTPQYMANYSESSFLPATPYGGGSESPASYHSQLSTPHIAAVNPSNSNLSQINAFMSEHASPRIIFLPNLMEIGDQAADTENPIKLPDIKSFVPDASDNDVSDTLQGLYKAHCLSMFQSFRHMHLSKLFNLLSTFHTSLTAPVLKLYSRPEVLPWVVLCDTLMYKAILKMLAKLVLQDIPSVVLEELKKVATTYGEKVSSVLGSIPTKLAFGKIQLAKQFAQLVQRLVRVSETSQTAHKILTNELDRDIMYTDWLKYVNIEEISKKELPCEGEKYTGTLQGLQTKVLELLKKQGNGDPKLTPSSPLAEWGTYISTLPQQFPDVPPKLFLLCTSALLTSALREISLAGGAGFGAWWVLRCWIDEWVGWCAELGGFLGIDTGNEGDHDALKKTKSNGTRESDTSNNDQVDLLGGLFGNFTSNTTDETPQNGNEPK